MIKKRLIGLLKESKKYIVQNVLWQWLGLLAQIVAILAIGQLLNTAIFGSITGRQLFLTGMICVSVIFLRMISDKKAAEASFLASSDVKRVLREKIYENWYASAHLIKNRFLLLRWYSFLWKVWNS